ncbi:MAG: hypothetical protein Q8K43_10475 [Sulfurimicrobium sp.]|nr:hypothetical protein [Gallionella sp.]MDP1898300.1 hypothetical protein [Sulfurimicrobium sp.]
MKLSCPGCGAIFSLDALLGNEGAREAVMAAMQLPAPLGWHMIRYIALFRPAQRQLSLDRVANLINELLPMITAARIERNGRTCSAPQDYWRMAMDDMLAKRDTLTLPLKSHGYLLTIIEGYGLKADQRREQQHEDKLAGRTPVGGVSHHTPSPDVKPVLIEVSQPRSVMPQSVKEILKSTRGG